VLQKKPQADQNRPRPRTKKKLKKKKLEKLGSQGGITSAFGRRTRGPGTIKRGALFLSQIREGRGERWPIVGGKVIREVF